MYQSVGYWECPVSISVFKKLDKGVSNCVGNEILMLVTMNNIVIWDVILCSVVEI